jgi:hypothetical protein
MTKFERVTRINEIVARLGRATPQLVVEKIAASLDPDVKTENLRRSVYRDLKELAIAGRLAVEYFSSTGVELASEPTDSDKKNFRVEYFVPNLNSKIVGGEILESHGGQLLFGAGPSVNWKVSDSMPVADSKLASIVIEVGVGEFLTLSVSQSDLPCKIVLARRPNEGDVDPAVLSDLAGAFGERCGLLLMNERHLSRAINRDRLGHLVIDFSSTPGTFKVRDLGSTGGTFSTPLSPAVLKFISKRTIASRAMATLIPGDSSLFNSLTWEKLETEAEFKSSILIKAGKVLLALM